MIERGRHESVHLVLGSFVMAVVIGRLRKLDRAAIQPLRHVGMALFVPFFFAYTGIKVNLTTLHGSALVFAVALVSVACAGKILGAAWGPAWAASPAGRPGRSGSHGTPAGPWSW